MTVIAAMLLGVGFVLQQHAAAKLGSSYLHLRLIAQLLRRRIWLGGVAVMIVGQALSAWGLGHLSLTVSEPLLATNLIFALLLAAPISGEIPRRTELAGAVLLCAGVAALSASRSVRALAESFGSFSHWPDAAIIAGVAAALVIAGRNGPANLRATLTGAGGGLLLGIADALTRRSVQIIDAHGLSTLLATWPGYAVICTAAVGLWLVQSAFSTGHLHTSLPAITAAEPLAGMALGVLVFGDVVHITPWLLALQAAGVAAMVTGTILVARAPVFVKLHLQHAGEHGLPKLTLAVGPPADEAEAHAPAGQEAAEPPAVPANPAAATGPLGHVAAPGSGQADPAGKDTTASAVIPVHSGPVHSGPVHPGPVHPGPVHPGPVHPGPVLSGTVAGPAFPALPGLPISGLRFTGLRVTWQWIARLFIPRLRVPKVPPPPAAR